MATGDEVERLCAEISRISGGSGTVKFGDLLDDELVMQAFEDLSDTLSSAKKNRAIDFDGEMLLEGRDDNATISLVASSDKAVTQEAAEAPADLQSNDVEEAPADLQSKDVESPAAPAPLEESAVAEESPSTACNDDKNGKWAAVDTSVSINNRTADPNNLQTRRSQTQEMDGNAVSMVPVGTGTIASKNEDGKWQQVPTTYVDHRTADPNNLEARAQKEKDGSALPLTSQSSLAKAEDGKWQQVNTAYVDHRTSNVDNLEGRRASQTEAPAGNLGPSAVTATTKKEADGKWKVDMGYINNRTVDTTNRTKNEEAKDEKSAFADPAEKKYPYAELKGSANRPPDVDPARKECYIATAEFTQMFGMSLEEFLKLPKWKQQNQKKAKDVY